MTWSALDVAYDGVFCDALGEAYDGYFCEREVRPRHVSVSPLMAMREERDLRDLMEIASLWLTTRR